MNQKIKEFVKEHQQDIINDWHELVNLEGSYREKDNMLKAADWLQKKFSEAGVDCKVYCEEPEALPVVAGVLGADRKGVPVLFSGHFDTVFDKGTFGEDPFRIDEEGKAHGPGVLDMKGGVIITLYVLKALNAIGYDERPIRICFCSDEEGGKHHDIAAKIIYRYSDGCAAAFNMETSPVDYKLCTGRKWALGGKAIFHGVSAHSGNNYEVGRNAILEAAYKVIAIQNMNNMELGTNMNPAIIKGGTVANVIPDTCELVFSGRFASKAEIARVTKELKELFEKPEVDGVTIEYSIGKAGGGFEETDQNKALCAFVNHVCEAEGMHGVSSIFLGGGSDASIIAEAGTPVLCSCGVRGEWNHTDREYAVADSMFERVSMWTHVVTHMDEFHI